MCAISYGARFIKVSQEEKPDVFRSFLSECPLHNEISDCMGVIPETESGRENLNGRFSFLSILNSEVLRLASFCYIPLPTALDGWPNDGHDQQ